MEKLLQRLKELQTEIIDSGSHNLIRAIIDAIDAARVLKAGLDETQTEALEAAKAAGIEWDGKAWIDLFIALADSHKNLQERVAFAELARDQAVADKEKGLSGAKEKNARGGAKISELMAEIQHLKADLAQAQADAVRNEGLMIKSSGTLKRIREIVTST